MSGASSPPVAANGHVPGLRDRLKAKRQTEARSTMLATMTPPLKNIDTTTHMGRPPGHVSKLRRLEASGFVVLSAEFATAHYRPCLMISQGEIRLSVSAWVGLDKPEWVLILCDGEQVAIVPCPAGTTGAGQVKKGRGIYAKPVKAALEERGFGIGRYPAQIEDGVLFADRATEAEGKAVVGSRE